MPAQVTWAATGVLLQAAIADPDFIQPRLADSKAWPALLAASRSRCSPIAQQHATLIARLGPSSIALQGLYTGRAQATHAGQASAAKQLSAQTDAGTASDASLRQQSQQSNSPGHEAEHSKAKALNTSNGNDPQRPHHAAGTDQGKAAGDWDVADLASAECEIAQAGTAGHVAQLIRLILQTTDCVADGNASSGHASKEALNAMLHCYVVHAQDAAGVLTAPVWCVQAHRQKAQQSMVQHAAEAGTALAQQCS